MHYAEITLAEARERCDANAKVLVATQDLKDANSDIIFISKRRHEYEDIFKDVKTVVALADGFIKRLDFFTEKQDIKNIRPQGLRRIILLRE